VTAFDPTALWAKSKVFIEKGLLARDSADFATFHMWAALALELLGKSALAQIHPALVADPTKFESMLVACGRAVTDKTRSIAAKTVYERLKTLSKDFDEKSERFCVLMANRRNEELHSGSSPTTDLDPGVWVPDYWRIAEVISRMAARTIEDWIGDEEAARARDVVADASRIVTSAIEARIARCKAAFERKYPPRSSDRKQVLALAAKTDVPLGHRELVVSSDHHQRVECPACGASAWLFGIEASSHRRPIEYDHDNNSAWQLEDVVYFTEAFLCTVCSLALTGRAELDSAEMPEEYEHEREIEPDYEPDYGND
jgi:hypothetical protein